MEPSSTTEPTARSSQEEGTWLVRSTTYSPPRKGTKVLPPVARATRAAVSAADDAASNAVQVGALANDDEDGAAPSNGAAWFTAVARDVLELKYHWIGAAIARRRPQNWHCILLYLL